MKVIINEDCISCEACVNVCPDVYEMGDDGFAHPKMDDVPAELEGCAKEGCESCPVDAISLE